MWDAYQAFSYTLTQGLRLDRLHRCTCGLARAPTPAGLRQLYGRLEPSRWRDFWSVTKSSPPRPGQSYLGCQLPSGGHRHPTDRAESNGGTNRCHQSARNPRKARRDIHTQSSRPLSQRHVRYVNSGKAEDLSRTGSYERGFELISKSYYSPLELPVPQRQEPAGSALRAAVRHRPDL